MKKIKYILLLLAYLFTCVIQFSGNYVFSDKSSFSTTAKISKQIAKPGVSKFNKHIGSSQKFSFDSHFASTSCINSTFSNKLLNTIADYSGFIQNQHRLFFFNRPPPVFC